MRKVSTLLLSLLTVTALMPLLTVAAAEYPDHPVKMLTMVNPGAQIDLLTRALADALKNDLGQPVLVSNLPGGSHGSVMATELSAAPKDGYTLGVSATAAFTYSPHFTSTRYTIDNFEFFTLLGLNQSGIICQPDRPWNTLKEAFSWAKQQGKGLTYMFQGSDDRDVIKRIAAREGVQISLMPSTGGPSIISAVMGGHADLGHTGAIMFEYAASKKLKVLAATTPVRLSVLPEIPTLKEQGWDESVEMYTVLAAPKGLPETVRARLRKAVEKLAEDKTFRNFITEKLRMREVEFGALAATDYMTRTSARYAREAGK